MMSEKYRNLLLRLLEDVMIVSSWGISNITISEPKLSFNVDGFKYHGEVTIDALDESQYNVYLNGESVGRFKLNDLVPYLDRMIELSDSEYQKLFNQLFNNK